MTSPSRDPVQEARERVRSLLALDHPSSCAAVMYRKGKYLRSGKPCDCGAPIPSDALLAAFESALRASLVERVVGKVEALPQERLGGDRLVYRADVLAVLRAELSEGRTK